MEQSSRTVEERFNWEDGDATLPIGWKMRCSNYLRQELFINLQTTNRQSQQLSYCVSGHVLSCPCFVLMQFF